MNRPVQVGCEIRAALPASLQAVEEFFVEFRRENRSLLDSVNCFAAELLLREALTNAVVHGCHGDPGKQVRFILRLKGRHLLIAVFVRDSKADMATREGVIARIARAAYNAYTPSALRK